MRGGRGCCDSAAVDGTHNTRWAGLQSDVTGGLCFVEEGA